MKKFTTQIFLDGGDPQETRLAHEFLKKAGYAGLDGQTTNPTLIAAAALKGSDQGGGVHHEQISAAEAVGYYRRTVTAIAKVTKGPVSIQVLGDSSLTAEQMLTQARDYLSWIPNAVVKFPCTVEGLKAAEVFCQEGPVNITLVFSQAQAAAVYQATRHRGAGMDGRPFPVYVSPFVGRLDDRGESGMDVVANILEMYRGIGDNHVQVLTASVRTLAHIHYALWLRSPAITIPFKLFRVWQSAGFSLPASDFIYDAPGLLDIPYRELNLEDDWTAYDLRHPLTDIGLARFWEDWKKVVK